MRDAGREPSPPSGVEEGVDPGDAALAAAAASGDDRAFETIVRRHAGLVLTLGRRLLGSRDAAEDLLQDVFVKVHASLRGFRGEAALKTWIARIAVNAARNRRRDDARRLRVVAPVASFRSRAGGDGDEAPSLDQIAPDGAPSPERVAMSAAARERIEAALASLPRDFREALLLRESEGLSYEEIATVLGIEIGTVKSRIARARARLQHDLADLAGGSGA